MQAEVNIATEQIGNLLSASYDKASAKVENGQTVNWRIDPNFYKPPKNPAFPPGSVDFSPGWFALAHEVHILSYLFVYILDNPPFSTFQTLLHPIITSCSLRETTALPWLISMQQSSILLNAVIALTHRALYHAGHEAISTLKTSPKSPNIQTHDHAQSWKSVFSGISVITNRITVRHRDNGGLSPWYDLLFSSGTHQDAYLHLDDIHAKLSYLPGTAVLVCGKILSHSLPEWQGGERICIAHWMRHEIHHRLSVYCPEWCRFSSYIHLMNRTFAEEQRWRKKQV
jgi:hypothetical protein